LHRELNANSLAESFWSLRNRPRWPRSTSSHAARAPPTIPALLDLQEAVRASRSV